MESTFFIENWKFWLYVSNGCGIICKIVSPKGSTTECGYLGIDNRLNEYRTEANIKFGSAQLRLSHLLVDRLIKAVNLFIDSLDIVEPDHNFVRQ